MVSGPYAIAAAVRSQDILRVRRENRGGEAESALSWPNFTSITKC